MLLVISPVAKIYRHVETIIQLQDPDPRMHHQKVNLNNTSKSKAHTIQSTI